MEQLNLFNNIKRKPGLDPTSMQYRLDEKGIETIREEKGVFLEYKGKRIFRPGVHNCPQIVKREFGIDI